MKISRNLAAIGCNGIAKTIAGIIKMSKSCDITVRGSSGVNSNNILKIVIGGAGGVGKTALLYRYLHGEFLTDTSMVSKINFHIKELKHDGMKLSLMLWELGGQDSFRCFQPSCCKDSMAGIIFFDITRLETTLHIEEWVDLFRSNVSPHIPILLGGTKFDLATLDSINEVHKFAKYLVKKYGLTNYFISSSKTGQNIDEAFDYIVNLLLQRSFQENFPAVPSTGLNSLNA